MYCLNRHNQLHLLSTPDGEANRARQYATALLADSTEGLVFEPTQHKYFLHGKEIQSVSSIVGYYAPFDNIKVAEGCSANPRSKYYRMTVDEILQVWNDKAAKGTVVHEFGEACFLMKSGLEDMVDDNLKNRLTKNGLEVSSPKEEAVARWWDDLDLDRYVLIAKEARVVNPIMNYAGTFDLLLYDLLEHYYVLRDYKTNEDLFKWTKDTLRPPLTPIKADDHGKYTLQQNLYRIQLENIGIHIGSMELIWLKDNGSYENVKIDEYDTLIRYAMNLHKES